ncbi:MAG TPA: hypothetical protein VM680_08095 [Verrucomicrobiae bacterium]|nr:hypothetical protein [Verrucomicrobiae bacterium]
MSATTEEIVRVCESLPPEKQSEVADFARFLLAQQGDEAWEQLLNSAMRRPRLEVFMEASLREGHDVLDVKKL